MLVLCVCLCLSLSKSSLGIVSEALHSSLYPTTTAMFLSHPNNTLLLQEPRRWFGPSLQVLYSKATSLDPRVNTSRGDGHDSLCSKGTNERIREMFTKVEHSISSYDTAWVAMVPSTNSPQTPYFPGCVTWVLENQLPDGSWGFHRHPLLIKDVMLSTLACIIALKKWNVGEEHVTKGLQFIESNFSLMNDENQHTPLGFDIIFPGMIQYAQNLGLILPLSPVVIDALLQKRDYEFKSVSASSNEGRKVYLAYVSEGLGWLQDWRDIMKYQRKNGSLFNSPSTTAASLIHLHDTNSLKYLHSLTERFGNAVPTAYPVDMFSRLCFVDNLERLGIDRHFINEIRSVLDEIYRCWLHMDEEIFNDPATCALAFRILRMHGYDISSDALAQFDEDHLFSSCGTYVKDMGTVLELYRASQLMIFPAESILEELQSWSSHFLKQQISEGSKHKDLFCECITQEVEYALKFPYYASLERLETKRNVEHYNVNNLRILKTSYRFSNVESKDFLELAGEDFNLCQSIHRNELKQLERWVKENRLDTLKFARQKQIYCYFSAAATLFSPELSDARMSWAKNSVLTTVVDDFFDIGGSKEELENLIKLVEKWNGISTTDFYSEQVEILFSALKCTIDEIEEKAFAWQGRSVANHLIETWNTLLKSMMKEADWVQNKSIPTSDEYFTNGYVSFALEPIVLPTLYFIGPQLSEEVVRDPEYYNLYKHMSICGRLLNDIQGFKRESKEGKLNSVLLQVIHGNGEVSEEEAVEKTRCVIDSSRRELLRLVLQTKDSVLPRACKDVFWKMSKVMHLFYMKNDGYTSAQEMVGAVNAVIQEPLNVPL